ncbi:MAG: tRNA dihydrouridine(20/20a) synthase DusA [Arsenophonus sp.]|nr:MAG: tRNA dihydrouridine(20/20a) synthase DusA [Arsenophonus sp.]
MKIKNYCNFNRFSVAPMLDWTDRHCRYFHRILTKKTLLYTEMITTSAIIYGNIKNILNYNSEEHPLALQLGGNKPKELAHCAKIAQKYNYNEINLNIGCPSNKVKNGCFGASLMKEAPLVADCIKVMQDAVKIPVTIKTRIGIDNNDSYEFLIDFIDKIITNSPCRLFIIHARKACLSGLTPKQNREIPPLNYKRVYQLKKNFPKLIIVLNGGIKTINEAKKHLQYIDGVMLGRAVYKNPSLLMQVDSQIFGENYNLIFDKIAAIQAMYPYIDRELKNGTFLGHIIRPMLGMFSGVAGSRQWRCYLSKNLSKKNVDINIIKKALELIKK